MEEQSEHCSESRLVFVPRKIWCYFCHLEKPACDMAKVLLDRALSSKSQTVRIHTEVLDYAIGSRMRKHLIAAIKRCPFISVFSPPIAGLRARTYRVDAKSALKEIPAGVRSGYLLEYPEYLLSRIEHAIDRLNELSRKTG